MGTVYITTQGCNLFVIDDVTNPATPAVVSVGAVRGVQSIGGSTSDIDITNLDSLAKEFAKGLMDGGSPSFDIVFNPKNSSHILMNTLANLGTGATKHWFFGLSDGTSAPTVTNGLFVSPSATTPLTAPVAPVPTTATTGGTVAAGTYQVVVTYVNAYGETVGSTAGPVTTTGATSTITIPSPTAQTGATGWYAYVSQAGGTSASATRQQVAGSPTAIGTGLTLTAPPTSTGLTAPAVNTTGGIGRSSIAFDGYVKQMQFNAAIDGALFGKVQLKASGQLTITAHS